MTTPVDALLRPGVVLCPPLTWDTPAPDWHEALARHLADLGTPTVRTPAMTADSGAGAPPGSATDGPGRDRMALAAWVADQAVAITGAGMDRPLVLVASGPATSGLPALGFSQRASRRRVVAYVLVDGPLPQVGPATGDWPDAPVVCVLHSASAELAATVTTGARLRGWRLLHDDPVAVLGALVRRWPDLP